MSTDPMVHEVKIAFEPKPVKRMSQMSYQELCEKYGKKNVLPHPYKAKWVVRR